MVRVTPAPGGRCTHRVPPRQRNEARSEETCRWPSPRPTATARSPPTAPRPTARPIPPEEAAEAAVGLDMVLVDAARGPLRRLVPPAGTAARFGSALARQPGTVARRTGGAGAGTGPDHRGQLRAGTRQEGQAVRRPGVERQPVPAPGDADAPGRRAHGLGADRGRRPRLAGRRADPLHRDQPGRRAGTEQRPLPEPAGAEGGHRHRREERRQGSAAAGQRPDDPAARALDGRPGRLHRGRGPRRTPRAPSSSGRTSSSSSSTGRRRRPSARCRC